MYSSSKLFLIIYFVILYRPLCKVSKRLQKFVRAVPHKTRALFWVGGGRTFCTWFMHCLPCIITNILQSRRYYCTPLVLKHGQEHKDTLGFNKTMNVSTLMRFLKKKNKNATMAWLSVFPSNNIFGATVFLRRKIQTSEKSENGNVNMTKTFLL